MCASLRYPRWQGPRASNDAIVLSRQPTCKSEQNCCRTSVRFSMSVFALPPERTTTQDAVRVAFGFDNLTCPKIALEWIKTQASKKIVEVHKGQDFTFRKSDTSAQKRKIGYAAVEPEKEKFSSSLFCPPFLGIHIYISIPLYKTHGFWLDRTTKENREGFHVMWSKRKISIGLTRVLWQARTEFALMPGMPGRSIELSASNDTSQPQDQGQKSV